MNALACFASGMLSVQVSRQMAQASDRPSSTTALENDFEGDVAVVADVEQGIEGRVEIDDPVAEIAAVAFADVEVADLVAGQPIAAAGFASSMFMWKVSRCSDTSSEPVAARKSRPCAVVLTGWSRTG